jgi:hypothetical protein
MNVTGLYVEEKEEANTKEAVLFALKYFQDLGYETSDGTLTDKMANKDIAVISVPYVGANIASGFEYVVDKLNEEQDVHWFLMLIKDDVKPKGDLTIDQLAEALKERGKVDILRFDNMTSERYIPLQTREMMHIMKSIDQIHKQYQ